MANTDNLINIGDTYKALDAIQVNIGDAWKDVTEGYINVGDTWKQFWTAGSTPDWEFTFGTAEAYTSYSAQYFDTCTHDGGIFNCHRVTASPYNGAGSYATIANDDEPTFGSVYNYNTSSYYNKCISLDSTHVVVFYDDRDNSDKATMCIGTVNSSTKVISWGTEKIVNNASSAYCTLIKIDDTHVVAGYRDTGAGSRGTCRFIEIDATADTISMGAEKQYNLATTYYIASVKLTDTTFMMVYNDVGNSQYGTAIVGTITTSTKAITFGSEHVWNSANSQHISAQAMDSTHVLITYRDLGNLNYGTCVICEVSGSTITHGTEYVFTDTSTYYTTTCMIDSTHAMIAYRDSDNSNYGTAQMVTLSNDTELDYSNELVFLSGTTTWIASTLLDSTHVSLTYSDGNNGTFGTTIIATIT